MKKFGNQLWVTLIFLLANSGFAISPYDTPRGEDVFDAGNNTDSPKKIPHAKKPAKSPYDKPRGEDVFDAGNNTDSPTKAPHAISGFVVTPAKHDLGKCEFISSQILSYNSECGEQNICAGEVKCGLKKLFAACKTKKTNLNTRECPTANACAEDEAVKLYKVKAKVPDLIDPSLPYPLGPFHGAKSPKSH
ncbi:MAG: hypothetical protein WCK43_01475 [bacterium]